MKPLSDTDAQRLVAGTHPDPFSVLGHHETDKLTTIRVFAPGINAIDVIPFDSEQTFLELKPLPNYNGLFEASCKSPASRIRYRLRMTRGEETWIEGDPYQFGPALGELDEHLISEGAHLNLWEVLGAHSINHESIDGVHFAVWAPNASRVSVVGNFNHWDGRRHCMRRRGATGVWEIFIPGLGEGEHYKYELLDSSGNVLPLKADPVGFGSEHPPGTASIVRNIDQFAWSDNDWMENRANRHSVDSPISIYEVHAGSWRTVQEQTPRPLSYLELADQLVNYVKSLGFTHIELMPISEFPFDGSWGYQPVGLFAPTIRFGTPNEFRAFVNACHNANIGVIIDWVPGHFPEDAHGLANFDGTALYEHADRREGFHPDWNTMVFNYGRREVANYLISNALYWLREFHIDGIRVDAVASMLYRDYSRKEGEWIPNQFGGRENLEAIAFLQRLNETCYQEHPGIMTIAEESTAFPAVCGMTSNGGLGFGYKWNMGWMNDTLNYISEDPVHRKYHHQKIAFGLHYAFSENFVLPISHDEVVHGKGSMLNRMPGDEWQRFANLRAYYGFMWCHPGKKLLFMGSEFAQSSEWSHQQSLDWHLLEYAFHAGIQKLIGDLNQLYTSTPALYEKDSKADGFQWIEENSAEESLFAWVRRGTENAPPILVVSNFTPVQREARRISVPEPGRWIEKLNTDAPFYGGGGNGNLGHITSESGASDYRGHSVVMTVPALSTLVFELERGD
jgi:1,4-alpha-glucan branching enzyme